MWIIRRYTSADEWQIFEWDLVRADQMSFKNMLIVDLFARL